MIAVIFKFHLTLQHFMKLVAPLCYYGLLTCLFSIAKLFYLAADKIFNVEPEIRLACNEHLDHCV